MSTLPPAYNWLMASLALNWGHPLMVAEAVRLYGTHEGDGARNNPVIMGWVEELKKLPNKGSIADFTNDHRMPWCGLFMAHCASVARYDFPDHPLWALNWIGFGVRSPQPSFGDILIFHRAGGGGHVGLYVGENHIDYYTLGGNERDAVGIVMEPKSRIAAIRRPPYHVAPANVRPVQLTLDGEIAGDDQ